MNRLYISQLYCENLPARVTRIEDSDGKILCKMTYASDDILDTKLSVLPDSSESGYDIMFSVLN